MQTGRARGSTIEFSAGGSGYRIVCDKPVTTSADRPLYVLHDAQAAGNYQGEMASFGSAGPPGLK